MIYFVRHANRMDRSNDKDERKRAKEYVTDIPLSKEGI
jgi:hypothetical protein